jgi:hypothetical protein
LCFFGKQPADKTLDPEPIDLDRERHGHEGCNDDLENITASARIDICISVSRKTKRDKSRQQGYFGDILKKNHLFTSSGSALDKYNRKPSILKIKYIIVKPLFQPREVKFSKDLGRRHNKQFAFVTISV